MQTLAVLAVALMVSTSRAEEPIGLKVLYAGNPGSDRQKDFVAFLGEHFTKVGTTDYREFKEGDAKPYDVVIFDWTSIYPRDKDGKIPEKFTGLNSPTAPKLSRDYDRPTILIGAAGAYLAMPLQLKINWL
jgi:hypothetical protein